MAHGFIRSRLVDGDEVMRFDPGALALWVGFRLDFAPSQLVDLAGQLGVGLKWRQHWRRQFMTICRDADSRAFVDALAYQETFARAAAMDSKGMENSVLIEFLAMLDAERGAQE